MAGALNSPKFTIPSGGMIQVTIAGTLAGQRTLTVLHYEAILGGGTDQGWQELGGLLDKFSGPTGSDEDLFWWSYLSAMSQDWVWAFTQAQLIYPTRYIFRRLFGGEVVTGTQLSPALPPNVCGCVTKKDAGEGDTARTGHVHVPALPSEWVAGGTILPDGLTALQSLATNTKRDVEATGGQTYTPIIYRRDTPAQSRIIVDARPEYTVRTQRTRTVGQGE